MTVDYRTRIDWPLPAVDPAAFFERELPAAFAAQVAPAAAWLAPPPHGRHPRRRHLVDGPPSG